MVRGERSEPGELRVGPEQVGGSVGELFRVNDPLCRCLLRGVTLVGDAHRSGTNSEYQGEYQDAGNGVAEAAVEMAAGEFAGVVDATGAKYLHLVAVRGLLSVVEVVVGNDKTESGVVSSCHLSVESRDTGQGSGLIGDGGGNHAARVEVAWLDAAPDPFVRGEFVKCDGDGGRE